MVPRAVLAAAAVLALLVLPIAVVAGEAVDHLYLMKLLDITLENAVKMNSNYYWAVIQIRNAELPGQLGDLHRRAYDLLSKYFYIVSTLERGEINESTQVMLFQEVHYLELELREAISQYSNFLIQNAEDSEQAKTLGVNISLKLETLVNRVIPFLEQAVANYLARGNFEVVLSPPKEAYLPGENLSVVIKPKQESTAGFTGVSEVLVWPSMIPVGEAPCTACDGALECSFTIPTLRELLEKAGESSILPTGEKYVKLLLRTYMYDQSGKLSGFSMLFVNVAYELPRLELDMPYIIYLGEGLNLTIASDSDYNVSVFIDDTYLFSAKLFTGLNTYYISPEHIMKAGVGTHNVVIKVNATSTTIPYVYKRAFIIDKKTPRLRIDVLPIVYTWDGRVTLRVINFDNHTVHLRINTPFFTVNTEVYSSAEYNLLIGFLPVLHTSLKVYAYSDQPYTYPLEETLSITVVNPVATLFVVLAALLLVPALVSKEKSFIVSLQLFVRRGRGLITAGARVYKSYLLELKYNVRSRIAELYYGLIRRLRLSYPEPHETLREHFKRLMLRERLKQVLWKLLLLVEKDLYSRSKPSEEEARKLVEEAVTVEE